MSSVYSSVISNYVPPLHVGTYSYQMPVSIGDGYTFFTVTLGGNIDPDLVVKIVNTKVFLQMIILSR